MIIIFNSDDNYNYYNYYFDNNFYIYRDVFFPLKVCIAFLKPGSDIWKR